MSLAFCSGSSWNGWHAKSRSSISMCVWQVVQLHSDRRGSGSIKCGVIFVVYHSEMLQPQWCCKTSNHPWCQHLRLVTQLNSMNHLKANLQKFPPIRARSRPLRGADKYRYMQTSAYAPWKKWRPCFRSSTFCSFALPSLSPEGLDSSASGEISCMIEQHRKEALPSSVWQSPPLSN